MTDLKKKTETLARQRIFNSLVIHNPSRAHIVRSLMVGSRVESTDTEYWQSLATTLRSLTGLKRLHFWCANSSAVPIMDILEGCTFQLEDFTWLPSNGPPPAAFLESQPLIKHLSLLWDAGTQDLDKFSLSPSALPNLQTLEGSQGVINAVLPGRPRVRRLHWSSGFFRKTMQDMPRIGPALSSIRALRYTTTYANPDFTHVVMYLANLEVLSCNSIVKVCIPLQLSIPTLIAILCAPSV